MGLAAIIVAGVVVLGVVWILGQNVRQASRDRALAQRQASADNLGWRESIDRLIAAQDVERRHHRDDLHMVLADGRQERRFFINALLADSAIELARVERAAVDTDTMLATLRAQASAQAPEPAGSDAGLYPDPAHPYTYDDPDTGEEVVPIGLGGG